MDANVFISAFINTTGAPSAVVDAWLDGRHVVVLSEPLREEIREVSVRPATVRYFRATAAAISTVLANLKGAAEHFVPDPVAIVADDPDDDLVLGTASAGSADYIVSGDKHLLALGSFRGIPIVTPAQFLRILAAEEEELQDGGE